MSHRVCAIAAGLLFCIAEIASVSAFAAYCRVPAYSAPALLSSSQKKQFAWPSLRSAPRHSVRAGRHSVRAGRSVNIFMGEAAEADPLVLAAEASFSEAQGVGMKLGMEMVEQLEKTDSIETSAQDVLNTLISHSDGARGWWVTSLTVSDMEPLFASEQGSAAMAEAVLANPDPNRRLLAMNIAMSTATAEYWKEQGEQANAEGSMLTQRRTALLLRRLLPSLSGMKEMMADLKAAAAGETTAGEWTDFLNRWGYGAKQREAIVAAIDDASA